MRKEVYPIAIIGAILSIIIYFLTVNNDINLVAIGDSLANGSTAYNIKGYSFNDYLKNDYKDKHILKNYYEYTHDNKTVKELIYEIKENKKLDNSNIELKQAINEADILTVAIGLDEITKIKLTKANLNEFQHDFLELSSMIKMLNNKKVIILGVYKTPNNDILNIARINAIIRDIALDNDFIFVDIDSYLNDKKYFFDEKSRELNYLGHEVIYNEIKKCL